MSVGCADQGGHPPASAFSRNVDSAWAWAASTSSAQPSASATPGKLASICVLVMISGGGGGIGCLLPITEITDRPGERCRTPLVALAHGLQVRPPGLGSEIYQIDARSPHGIRIAKPRPSLPPFRD